MTPEELNEVTKHYTEDLLEVRGLEKTSQEWIDTWKYNHHIQPCRLQIHIPPEFESTEMYQGTLGHKVNHKFAPKNNCVYGFLDSARFGPIVTVETNRDVGKGEELFASYGYPVNSTILPWYAELYKKHLEDSNSGLEKIQDFVSPENSVDQEL